MSDDYGIKPEWKEAWRIIAGTRPTIGPLLHVDHLADGFLSLIAKLMESEFRREHRLDGRRDLVWCPECSYGDVHRVAPPDLRHNYDDAAWLEAARKYLSGGDDE